MISNNGYFDAKVRIRTEKAKLFRQKMHKEANGDTKSEIFYLPLQHDLTETAR
jgi:hypothetical protein